MSDAALIGRAENPSEKIKSESGGHIGAAGNIASNPGATVNATGGGSHVTTSGSVVSSDDPSTNPRATVAQKLKGDASGAVKGTVGAIQGAVGATIRNKDMEQKGLDKMQEEDERLGAKRGVMPVGSDRRTSTTDAATGDANIPR